MFEVQCFQNSSLLAHHLAQAIQQELQQPQPANQPFGIMLAGGSTPMAAYQEVANHPFDLSHGAYFLLSDERVVAIDSPDSNFSNISPLFSALSVPQHRLLFVETDQAPEKAAAQYDQEITRFFNQGGRLPLGFLGLGTDGHTASLFTPEDLSQGQGRYAVPVDRPDGHAGVSVTPALLARIEKLVFVVAGESKHDMVQALISNPETITAGQAVAGHPALHLWVDKAAHGP